MKWSDQQLVDICATAEELFAQAVAQGLHAPFAINCDHWGRWYAAKLCERLQEET